MSFKPLIAALILLMCPAVLRAQEAEESFVPEYYIPNRIYDAQSKQWIDLETMLASIVNDDVLFLGEQHNDDYAHRLQLAILQGAARRRSNVVLAMEMFERDVQPIINNYFKGQINETEFLAQSRPWTNYLSDYRPLVEFARVQGWQVIGSNAPQRLARAVSANGIDIVDKFPEYDRKFVAKEYEYPHDGYWDRFSQVMLAMSASHGGGGANNPHAASPTIQPSALTTRIEQLYQAQCLKDETMAESIASIIKERESSKPLIIHVNGDFHSAFGDGAVARARRRMPNARIKNASIIPVRDLDHINAEEFVKQGNYLIFTLAEKR